MAVALDYVTSTSNTADSNVYTFSGTSVGAEGSDRQVVVVVSGIQNFKEGALAPTVTVGGVAAVADLHVNPSQQDTAGNGVYLGIFRASLPTGTTADIVVDFGADMLDAWIAVYRLTGASPGDAADTAQASGLTTGSAIGLSLDVPEVGAAVGGVIAYNHATPSATWAELTEDVDTSIYTTDVRSSASAESAAAAAPLAVTVTVPAFNGSGVDNYAAGAVSYGPLGDAEAVSDFSRITNAVVSYTNRSDIADLIPTFLAMMEAKLYAGERSLDGPGWTRQPLRIRSMVTTGQVVIANGQADLSSQLVRYLEMERVYENGRALEYLAPKDYWSRVGAHQTSADWSFYTVEGFKLRHPRDVTLEVAYYQRYAQLSTSTDTNWLVANQPQIYVHGLLAEAYEWEGSDALAERHGRKFNALVNSLDATEEWAAASGSPLIMRPAVVV